MCVCVKVVFHFHLQLLFFLCVLECMVLTWLFLCMCGYTFGPELFIIYLFSFFWLHGLKFTGNYFLIIIFFVYIYIYIYIYIGLLPFECGYISCFIQCRLKFINEVFVFFYFFLK